MIVNAFSTWKHASHGNCVQSSGSSQLGDLSLLTGNLPKWPTEEHSVHMTLMNRGSRYRGEDQGWISASDSWVDEWYVTKRMSSVGDMTTPTVPKKGNGIDLIEWGW